MNDGARLGTRRCQNDLFFLRETCVCNFLLIAYLTHPEKNRMHITMRSPRFLVKLGACFCLAMFEIQDDVWLLIVCNWLGAGFSTSLVPSRHGMMIDRVWLFFRSSDVYFSSDTQVKRTKHTRRQRANKIVNNRRQIDSNKQASREREAYSIPSDMHTYAVEIGADMIRIPSVVSSAQSVFFCSTLIRSKARERE